MTQKITIQHTLSASTGMPLADGINFWIKSLDRLRLHRPHGYD